ncbi:MAG: cobalamin biosynthesis protein CobQ [Pseudomonadota bacterium]
MNTPAHLIIGAAIFAKPGQPKVTSAALLGAILPDLSLYLLAGWALFVQGLSPNHVFGTLYFSPAWQQIFAVDNSVFVWAGLIGLGLVLRQKWLWVLAAAALIHVACDFPLHHDDGRAHFWPLSNWVFESPVSYWDPQAYGTPVGVLEALLCLGLLTVLWRRFDSLWVRALLGVAAVAQIAPYILFAVMFAA